MDIPWNNSPRITEAHHSNMAPSTQFLLILKGEGHLICPLPASWEIACDTDGLYECEFLKDKSFYYELIVWIFLSIATRSKVMFLFCVSWSIY